MKRLLRIMLAMAIFLAFPIVGMAKPAEAVEGQDYLVTYKCFEPYMTSFGQAYYYAVVELENIGDENLYLDTVESVFEFCDAEGNVLDTERMLCASPDVLQPGEKGYYYPSFGRLQGVEDFDAHYEIVADIHVEKSELPVMRNTISDVELYDNGNGSLGMAGQVTNTTDRDDLVGRVFCVLYNSYNQPVGIGTCNIGGLETGETKDFDIAEISSRKQLNLYDISGYQIFSGPSQHQY